MTSSLTDDLDGYNIVWYPPATYSYLLKTEWLGNSTLFGVSNIIVVSTLPYENQYIFAVESHSSISELNFNTNNWKLSFLAPSPDGTSGFVKVTIAG